MALRAVQLYAPLAQAIGLANIGVNIEALSYRRLFPGAMLRLATWYKQVVVYLYVHIFIHTYIYR